jgi:hypothetical protein
VLVGDRFGWRIGLRVCDYHIVRRCEWRSALAGRLGSQAGCVVKALEKYINHASCAERALSNSDSYGAPRIPNQISSGLPKIIVWFSFGFIGIRKVDLAHFGKFAIAASAMRWRQSVFERALDNSER